MSEAVPAFLNRPHDELAHENRTAGARTSRSVPSDDADDDAFPHGLWAEDVRLHRPAQTTPTNLLGTTLPVGS